jgi:Tol biopolymer transport system component
MLLFYGGENGTDIWTAMVDGSAEPAKIISSEGSQRGGRFSPGGGYIAYYSDESGPWEVYVQPYPALDRRWVVSSSGGTEPVWAADGSELFFRDGTRMLSVTVTLTPEFSIGAETVLFESPMWSDPFGDQSYDVFADGQSFAMYQSDAAGEPRLRVLTDISGRWP